GLVEDLLTIDRLEAGKLDLDLELVALDGVVQEAFDTLRAKAGQKSLLLESEVGTAQVVADRMRIMQVMMNLVSNAIKFSPSEGRIRVDCRTGDNKLTVSVADQGPGIAKAKQNDLFERFYQVERFNQTAKPDDAKGFGLGLAICKMIVVQ